MVSISGSGWPLWAARRTSPAAVSRTCPTAVWRACVPGPSRCVEQERAAYAAGVRYVDTARSYGLAEEFLAGWLAERGHADVSVGSKWGYRYTGGWRLDAPAQEVKEHSLAMDPGWAKSRGLLGDRLTLYQVALADP